MLDCPSRSLPPPLAGVDGLEHAASPGSADRAFLDDQSPGERGRDVCVPSASCKARAAARAREGSARRPLVAQAAVRGFSSLLCCCFLRVAPRSFGSFHIGLPRHKAKVPIIRQSHSRAFFLVMPVLTVFLYRFYLVYQHGAIFSIKFLFKSHFESFFSIDVKKYPVGFLQIQTASLRRISI